MIVVIPKEFKGVFEDDIEVTISSVWWKRSSTSAQTEASFKEESVFEHLLAANDQLMIEEKEIYL